MSQSLANILIHIVFSTKQRQPYFSAEIGNDLYDYLAGILKNKNCHPHQIGGASDHIHILCAQSKNITLSTLIEQLKTGSSKWIKTKNNNFYWQNGYGAFSISPAHLNAVKLYIANQLEHHRKISFQDEMRNLLNKYGIEYNEKYLWD